MINTTDWYYFCEMYIMIWIIFGEIIYDKEILMGIDIHCNFICTKTGK